MNLDLGGISTTTIKQPKIQETSTLKLLNCFISKKVTKFCNENAKKEMTAALNRRMVMPFYIPVISLLCSLLLISKSSKLLNRYLIFAYSFLLLMVAEMIVRYTGIYDIIKIIFLITPVFLIVFIYLFLTLKLSRTST